MARSWKLLANQSALLMLKCCYVTEGWQQHMVCPNATGSACEHTSYANGIDACRQLKSSTRHKHLTTSGTAPTQDSEQEATDKSLELGATKRPIGSSESGGPRGVLVFCSAITQCRKDAALGISTYVAPATSTFMQG